MRTSVPLSLMLFASLLVTGCPDDADGPTGPVIDTVLGADTTVAGVSVTVGCAAPEGMETQPRVTPADGVTVADGSLTATLAGTYQVACAQIGGNLVDETPATLTVTPGAAKSTRVVVDPAESRAGEAATVTCEVVDAHGNALPEYVGTPRVTPDDGVSIDGDQVTGTLQGHHQVTCSFSPAAEAPVDSRPWTVVPGPADKLLLALTPSKKAYRTDEAITVEAHAFDAFGNKIGGPVAVETLSVSPQASVKSAPPQITIRDGGTYTLTATGAGSSGAVEVHVDAVAPEAVVNTPERGTTKAQEPLLLVNGAGSDDVALASVRVNGELALVDENTGGFSHDWTLSYGLSTLHVAAEDLAGNVGETWRSAGWSSAWYPMDPADLAANFIPAGLQVVLTQAVLDDGVHDPADVNDIATLVETIMTSLDIGALVPDPLGSFLGCDYHLQQLSTSGVGVTLTLADGHLEVDLRLEEFALKVSNSGGLQCTFHDGKEPGELWGGTGPLQYSADALVIESKLTFQTSGGKLVPKIDITKIDSDGTYNVNIPVIDDIVDGFFNFFLGILKGLIAGQLNNVFGDLIGSFEMDLPIELPALGAGEPTAIRLKARPASGSITKKALRLELSTMAHAETPQRPHEVLGSVSYAGCGEVEPVPVPSSPMSLALQDDLLNQILFAVWDGGLLNQTLGAEALGSFDLSKYGISDLSVLLDARLPLVLNTCGDTDRIQIGDLYVDATFIMADKPTRIALWIQGDVPVELSVAENDEGVKELGFALGDLDSLKLEVAANEGMFEGNDAALLLIAREQLLPQMLGALSGGLGSFPIPEIDLSTLAEGLPEGATLSIDVDAILTGGGTIRLNAGL